MKPTTPDLSTTYLGLPLRSPFIVSASPLSNKLETLEQAQHYGAGAVVFKSLFEESLDQTDAEPDFTLGQITRAKEKLSIPVIGSLSARTRQGWSHLARRIEKAGADAIELNIYEMSLSVSLPASVIESRYIETVQTVVAAVKIPVSIKLPPFFTNLAYVAKELEEAGVKGLVLFNRFYLPDTDLKTMGPAHSLRLSTSTENRLPLRWISLLYLPIQADLVASTGIHTGEDALKMILAGAAATEVCAALLQRGVSWLENMTDDLAMAMNAAGIQSLREARGGLSHRYTQTGGTVEREEYQNALQGYAQFGNSAVV